MTSEPLVKRLQKLAESDRGAMAVLRRSLAFAPGSWPQAYPYVEKFVCGEKVSQERRMAAYLTAGLFAMHRGHRNGISLGQAFGLLAKKRPNSSSIETRFLGLLAADEDLLANRLRQAVSLLRTDGIELDFGQLLKDLTWWNAKDRKVQQRWASDYYRTDQNPETNRDE